VGVILFFAGASLLLAPVYTHCRRRLAVKIAIVTFSLPGLERKIKIYIPIFLANEYLEKLEFSGFNTHHLNANTISSEAALQIPPAFS